MIYTLEKCQVGFWVVQKVITPQRIGQIVPVVEEKFDFIGF
jgi:hypothetical protein